MTPYFIFVGFLGLLFLVDYIAEKRGHKKGVNETYDAAKAHWDGCVAYIANRNKELKAENDCLKLDMNELQEEIKRRPMRGKNGRFMRHEL